MRLFFLQLTVKEDFAAAINAIFANAFYRRFGG